MRYRKKPVEIDAIPIREIIAAASHDWDGLPRWVSEAYDRGELVFTHGGVFVTTLEGNMLGYPDDMLIRGTRGEMYPCKPAPFSDSYEPVEPVAGGQQ